MVIEFQDEDENKHTSATARATRCASCARGARGATSHTCFTLRSWFWLLTKRSNSRIQQDKKALEVFDAVVEDSPVKRFKKLKTDKVIGIHEPLRYSVQHQESDYGFLSRLMEDEGVYYWFDAHGAPGTMHLADTSDVAHEKLPVSGQLDYVADAPPRSATARSTSGSTRAGSAPASSPRATATSRRSR